MASRGEVHDRAGARDRPNSATLDPEAIVTPGIFVQRVVEVDAADARAPQPQRRGVTQNEEPSMNRFTREQMAARVARDIPEGAYVNLGIGLPTLVANHLPKDREIILHSENGLLGMGPAPAPGDEDPDLINAGKQPVTLLPGGAYLPPRRFVRDDARRPSRLLRARRVPGVGRRAISPTGTPARRTRFPPSAARWTSRSAPSSVFVMMEHQTK